MPPRTQWIRRGFTGAVFGLAGVASHLHPEVTAIAIALVAIMAAVLIVSEN